MNKNQPRIVVVTGASRGAGKGIALAFGACGDTVYVTGRSQKEGDAALPGTVNATAEAVTAAGGKGIAAIVDHADDAQTEALFARVMAEQGRLDILVNNATFLHDALVMPGPFFEKPLGMIDILEVGLRSSYVAAWHAARIMAAQKHGLIVNTSSPGAACYMHGPAYGSQKAGSDKMIWDMAHDLKPFNVACVSLWMGVLRTERLEMAVKMDPDTYGPFYQMAETPEFTGRVIDALYRDKALMARTGQAFYGAELGLNLGVVEADGRQPPSHRDMLGGPIPYNPAVVQ